MAKKQNKPVNLYNCYSALNRIKSAIGVSLSPLAGQMRQEFRKGYRVGVAAFRKSFLRATEGREE